MEHSVIISRNLIESLSEWGRVLEHEPMKHYTSFRTGGPADLLVMPSGNRAVAYIVSAVRDAGLPLTIIGGGSNLLVSDQGIRGVVLRLCEDDRRQAVFSVLEDGLVYADSIASKERFIDFVVAAGFRGVEFMAGIPGCVGGGIMMNAGTFMGSFADILVEIDIVDASGSARTMKMDRSMSSYRTMNIDGGAVVTGARFRLERTDDAAPVRSRIAEILADRRGKHPLDYPSAGSVFKNPEGHSSWKLIDEAGLKGKRVGGAAVSTLHTNFIINADNATSGDIRALIDLVRGTVQAKFGIGLEAEVKMIGSF
jgi:UDP-N-acetylmuramate dehydrogenase